MNLEEKRKTIKKIIEELDQTDIIEIRANSNAFDSYSEQRYNINIIKQGRLLPMQIVPEEEIEDDEWD
jgi:hypothetical protein